MKEKKFTNIAEKRVNNLLKQIKLIGNLSNRASYSYTDEQVKKIFSSIRSELDTAHAKFKAQGEEKEQIFKLWGCWFDEVPGKFRKVSWKPYKQNIEGRWASGKPI